ncbi:MAG TPA: hypothetical protein VHO24_06955 [Opitutaceae bacterium]|nr:hypothetical protein [Opitutaceae bacterium]
MRTLKQMVQEQKAAETQPDASSEVAEAPVRSIQVHAWNGEKWVLPWGFFYSAHLQGTADREQLIIRIAHHEIVLEGVRLALLLPVIADLQLGCLRDLPKKFQVDTDQSVPFINRVSVRPITDGIEARGGTEST